MKFFNKYKKDDATILESIYRMPGPNAFIAGFTPFLHENIDNPFIRKLVMNSFTDFFAANKFPEMMSDRLSYGFSGSVAYAFRDILSEIMSELGIPEGPIIASPIEGLVRYHGGE
jgi:hypothetical protein